MDQEIHVWAAVLGVERTTFVIGADGVIREVLRKVKPGAHDSLVLGALTA